MISMAAAKKGKEKTTSISKGSSYSVSDGKVERTKPVCPKCGPGVFMAAHKDRVSCGKCGYTEFKKE